MAVFQRKEEAIAALPSGTGSGQVYADATVILIKLSSLMRSSRGPVKVVDFGLARSRSADPEYTQTQPGTIVGSPRYMPPEQCQGERADARSDLYSLTCGYFQFLTCQLPFSGNGLTALMYQQCHEPFPDAGKKVSRLPDGYSMLRISEAVAGQRNKFRWPARRRPTLILVRRVKPR